MKKLAFSYLELIISMALVVMVVILTTPFVTSLAKSNAKAFGEFKCYARYVCDDDGTGCEYKLFQNKRYNLIGFSGPDEQVSECEFKRPAGKITSYSVYLYGGGGGGARTHSEGEEENAKLYCGSAGIRGNIFPIAADTLEEAFEDGDKITIKFCDDVNNIDEYGLVKDSVSCIGKGGKGAPSDENGVINLYDWNYAKKTLKKNNGQKIIACDGDDRYACNFILAHCNDSNCKSLLNELKVAVDITQFTSLRDILKSKESFTFENKYYGEQGEATYFMTTIGQQVASGGDGGEPDDTESAECFPGETDNKDFNTIPAELAGSSFDKYGERGKYIELDDGNNKGYGVGGAIVITWN